MSDHERLFDGLLDVSHGRSLEQLPLLLREQAERAGLYGVSIYLADLQEEVLRRLTSHDLRAGNRVGGHVAELRIDGTPAGRSYTTLATVSGEGDAIGSGGHRYFRSKA